MGTVSGMLALALLGAEPTACTASSAASKPIVGQTQVMTIDALNWRAALGSELKSVSRQGNATVWVAPRSLQPALLKLAGSSAQPAQFVANPETSAAVAVSKSTDYVRHVTITPADPTSLDKCQLDQPIVHGMAISEIRVEQAKAEEKFEVRCSARRLDQGTLAQVHLADTHLAAMHKVPTVHEAGIVEFDFNIQNATDDCTSGSDNATPMDLLLDVVDTVVNTPLPNLGLARVLLGTAGCVSDGIDASVNPPVHLDKVEIPEVVAASVDGEWLVPANSMLVVSFGVHTGADAQGKAVVRERVAILDFHGKVDPKPAAPAITAARHMPVEEFVRVCEASGPAPEPVALSHLNTPAVPARSLPEAVDKDGRVVDLPPLPEAYAAVDLNQISPGSPQATPQAPLVRAVEPKPMADPQLARTSYADLVTALDEADVVAARPTPAAGSAKLGSLVEGFLRRGIGTTPNACPVQVCPAREDCAADCLDHDGVPPAPDAPLDLPPAANGGVKPGSTTVQTTFSTALQNPGTTETRFIPLGKGLALEVRVRVVPEPKDGAKAEDEAQTTIPRRAAELLVESDKLLQAGDQWERFWFMDQPSHMTPFRAQGGSNP